MPDEGVPDRGRRNFLKAMVVLSAGIAASGIVKGTVANIITPQSGLSSFPSLTLVDSSGNPIKADSVSVSNSTPVLFDYPLKGEPNFLLNLGKQIPSSSVLIPATGLSYNSPSGVGPNGNIVAFSAICQHLGCVAPEIHFYPPGSSIAGTSYSGSSNPGYLHCACHGSTYDPSRGAAVLTGPTTHPLPPVVLKYNADKTLTAVSMPSGSPTIFGKTSDLSGGTPLTGTTTEVTTIGS